MERTRVDYDQLARTYHIRYDHSRLEGIGDALLQLAVRCSARSILEAGCGTGIWIERLRETGASVMGADPSAGMLSEAKERLRSTGLVAARANELPFRRRHFDLIYCVNALHHFDDPHRFIGEAAALLRPGGALAVIGIDPRASRRRYFYEYFAGTFEMDMRRYPSFGQLVDWMWAAGLRDVAFHIVEKSDRSWTGGAVFEDPFMRKESNSMLALLTDEAYDRGLEKIRKAVEGFGESVEFVSELAFGMVWGRHADAGPEP